MNLDVQLTPHFHLKEFLHPGAEKEIGVDEIENLRKLAQKLEKVREQLGKPIIITSGYRTVMHNKKIGGARNSYHLKGMAADFVVAGLSPQKVQTLVDDWWPGGLEYAPTWTHLDLGPRRRFYP